MDTTTNKSVSLTIPKRSLWSFIGLIISLAFTVLNTIEYIIPSFNEIFSLTPEALSIYRMGLIIWAPLLSYGLIGLNVCLFVNILKPLKPYEGKGLIYCLIQSLRAGLIAGLIVGLTFGLPMGYFLDLIEGFSTFSIMHVLGLIVGLTFGLLWGLGKEF